MPQPGVGGPAAIGPPEVAIRWASETRTGDTRHARLRGLEAIVAALLVATIGAIVVSGVRAGKADGWWPQLSEASGTGGDVLAPPRDSATGQRGLPPAYLPLPDLPPRGALTLADAAVLRSFRSSITAIPAAAAKRRPAVPGPRGARRQPRRTGPARPASIGAAGGGFGARRSGQCGHASGRDGNRPGGGRAAWPGCGGGRWPRAPVCRRRRRAGFGLAGGWPCRGAQPAQGARPARRHARLATCNTRLAETVSDRTAELLESEMRFQRVFQDSPLGLTIASAKTQRIVAANPAFCRMFGYTEPELLGHTTQDFAHPDDAAITVPITTGPHAQWRPSRSATSPRKARR